MATKKDITEYCFFRFNTLGNTVTSVNIVKNTSRAEIVKQWKEKSMGSDTSPIFKGFVPPMPKKKKADPEFNFWNTLAISDQTKKLVKKGRK